VADGLEYATTMDKLVKENASLQEQLDEVSSQNRLLQQDKYDLENLKKLYDLDETYSNYPKVAAHVISSDGNWFDSFVIDKGSDDGLAVNMNVMAGDGLVGIITEVNKSYARVRSIVDDESNVTGSLLKTSDMCIVSGNLQLMNEGVIEVTGIPGDSKVKDGYEVVTSPISDKYLPGILIGYVRDLTTDSTNITQSGYLTPAADFSGLDMVLVITQVKDSGDLEDILT
jgi:rod shape-determining protein MreC